MHVIVLDYIAPLDAIDAALAEHVAWLDTHYAAGHFLGSGRREPRTGGVMLAADLPADQIREIAGTDPFVVRGLATHTVIEFHPSRTAGADAWAEALGGF